MIAVSCGVRNACQNQLTARRCGLRVISGAAPRDLDRSPCSPLHARRASVQTHNVRMPTGQASRRTGREQAGDVERELRSAAYRRGKTLQQRRGVCSTASRASVRMRPPPFARLIDAWPARQLRYAPPLTSMVAPVMKPESASVARKRKAPTTVLRLAGPAERDRPRHGLQLLGRGAAVLQRGDDQPGACVDADLMAGVLARKQVRPARSLSPQSGSRSPVHPTGAPRARSC